MATVRGLTVDYRANTAAWSRDLGRMEGALRSSSGKMNRIFRRIDRGIGSITKSSGRWLKSMVSLKGGIAGLIGIGAAGGLALLIKRSIEYADTTAKTADRIGITTSTLQEYRHVANLVGIETKALDGAFEAASKRIGEARAETGTLITLLNKSDKALLANVQAAKSTDEAFDLLFEAMAKLEKQTDRNALSAAFFGRTAGVGMTLMAKNGIEALKRMREEAHRLGLVLDESMLRSAEKANDALLRMERIISVNVTRVLLSLAPTVTRVGAAFAEAAPKIATFVEGLLPSNLVGVQEINRRIADTITNIERLKRAMSGDAGFGQSLAVGFGLDFLGGPDKLREMEKQLADLQVLRRRALAGEAALGLGLGGGGDGGGDGDANRQKRVDKVTAALRFQMEQLDRTATGQRVFNALKQAGIDADDREASGIASTVIELENRKSAQDQVRESAERLRRVQEEAANRVKFLFESTRTPAEQLKAELAELNRMLEDGRIDWDLYGRAVDAAQRRFDSAGDSVSELKGDVKSFGREATSSLQSVIQGANSLGEALANLASNSLFRLGGSFLDKGLDTLFDAVVGSIGGGGAIGGAGPGFPGLAHGGSVTAGQAYSVGEKGREVFLSGHSGTMIPNDKLGGTTNVFNVDMRGASVEAVARLERLVNAVNGSIERRAVAAAGDAFRRNPSFLRG